MKKVILALALATMIISCKKENKVEEVQETTKTVETEAPTATDTVIKTTTEKTTTVDTLEAPGS